jgi:diguanylate cyclase
MSARDAGNSISLRRSLFLRFSALATGCVALLTLGYIMFGLQPVAERIARSHFNTSVEKVDSALSHLFKPAVAQLGISRKWAIDPGFDIDRPDDFNRLFKPVLQEFPQITSVVAGDTAGHGWLLLELPGGHWRNRLTDVPQRGKVQHFIDWDAAGESVQRDEIIDYDARLRPWFTRAMSYPADGNVYWTPPYTFFTTKDPGITGSSRVDLPDGRSLVIGFDIKLLDISRITAALAVGIRGSAMVISSDELLLGMPRTSRNTSDNAIRAAVLKPVAALGIAPVSDAVSQWRNMGRQTVAEFRYISSG